ncbi:chemotaxis protein [Pseudomonas marginalis]|uniref:chemotaxis protein n=1 Tax=Pseudomonas marginalis TaxID=298 RepID=UPI0011B5E9CC|nr:chemotaxis protein [Pseudomonas marginalis]KAA8553761.1 hypothetical protein FX984_00371 [Pseudomonas marginalis]TWR73197.1 chemotaxis protein [Pseudomonas marginalis]
MKLVFRQYLASLRERNELDVVLPDLLSELGYNVISRPGRGTRQHGVDVMAVGFEKGEEKVYLFSVKQGDLDRAEWDTGEQGLRASLNEILEIYIPSRLESQYQTHKVVICLCFGGEIKEAVRDNVKGFTDRNSTERISFQVWNGDFLAALLSDGVLKQQLVKRELRTSFQKAVAMLDEPEIANRYFKNLVEGLREENSGTARGRLSSLRQMCICLWVLYVWARDANNLEAPYKACENTILQAWHLISQDLTGNSKLAKEARTTLEELFKLYGVIWEDFYGEKLLPHIAHRDAVAASVDARSSVDVNRKLFETMGRIALRGLWIMWSANPRDDVPKVSRFRAPKGALAIANALRALISNNPALLTPIADDQSIDVGITLLFLSIVQPWQPTAIGYSENILSAFIFTYQAHDRYPSIHGSYRELVRHPAERTDDYRKDHTKGSTLIPLAALWASAGGASERTKVFAKFAEEKLKHCTHQMWVAGSDSESKVYLGESRHGLGLIDIPVTQDGHAAVGALEHECRHDEHFRNLSAIKLLHWPILVLACRHHRLPLPPHLWLPALKEVRHEHHNKGGS